MLGYNSYRFCCCRFRSYVRNFFRFVDIVFDVRKYWRELNSFVRIADFCLAYVRVLEFEWYTLSFAGNLRGYILVSLALGYSDNLAGLALRRVGSNRTVNGWRDDIVLDVDR